MRLHCLLYGVRDLKFLQILVFDRHKNNKLGDCLGSYVALVFFCVVYVSWVVWIACRLGAYSLSGIGLFIGRIEFSGLFLQVCCFF